MNKYDRNILQLAVPSIVTHVTVPLLGLVDLAIVGHVGNETLIGAIAVGSMVFNIMYWLLGFLRMGTTGMTAQSINPSSILHRYLRLALIIAVVMILLQIPLRWLSLWLMGPSEEVAGAVRAYFNICIWGAPAVLSLYVMTGWFIGMQDTRTPMVVSISQNIINILLSLLFVFGFKMRIEGVALGTLIAQWSGAVMALWMVRRKLADRDPAPLADSEEQKGGSLLEVNRDLFFRTLCLVAVNLFFTSAGARQGDLMLSVNTLLMTFFTLFSYIMDGFASAGEALCGKYYGQAEEEAFHAVISRLFRWGWLMVILFTLLYVVGGHSFLMLLTDETTVVEAAKTYHPWTWLIPLTGMAAFVFDGIFVGILATRGMLVSCAIATVSFFAVHFSLFPLWGNHALWLALLVYLSLRGILQWIWIRQKENQLFDQR